MDNEIVHQQCLQDPYAQNYTLSPEEWDKNNAILQAHTSPEDMQEHTKTYLFIDDEKTDNSITILLQCNQSQHIEKLVACN